MKGVVLAFSSALLFSGCSMFNMNTPTKDEKRVVEKKKVDNKKEMSLPKEKKMQAPKKKMDTKQSLIESSKSGDVTSMMKLDKMYQYSSTKIGLDNFSKWYKNINQNSDVKDIYALAKLFEKNRDFIINGDLKTISLFKLAIAKGQMDAKFDLLKFYIKTKQKTNIKKLHDELLSQLNEAKLAELLSFYNKYKKSLAKDVREVFISKHYELPLEDKLSRIKEFSTKNTKLMNIAIEEIVTTKNKEDLLKTALLLNEIKKEKEACRVFKEILKLDSSDAISLYEMGRYYQKGLSSAGIKKDINEAISFYEKALANKSAQAGERLLDIYFISPKNMKDYLRVRDTLKQDSSSLLALASFYETKGMKDSAVRIYEELAKDNNVDAKIALVLLKKEKTYNPEYTYNSKVWYEDMLMNDMQRAELFKVLEQSANKRYFFKDLNDYYESLANVGDLFAMRKLVDLNRYTNKKKAIYWTNELVKNMDIKTTLDFANDYLNYKGLVKKDVKKAYSLYEDLGKKGEIKALLILAKGYNKPEYKAIKRDKMKSLHNYELAANYGSIEAQRYLSKYYMCEIECTSEKNIDYKKARIYLQALANENMPINNYTLGWLYQYTEQRDLNRARYNYEMAAKKGSKDAYYSLGWLYYSEDGFNDYDMAFKYFKDASDMGDLRADNVLGIFYENGFSVKKDINKALHYYEKSYKNGNKESAFNIGLMYDLKKSYKKAMKYFKIASSNPQALNNMAIYYEEGLGVKKNMKKAISLYKRAYAKGNTSSAYNLGLIYHYAKGVKRDPIKARIWYKRSTLANAKKHLYKLNDEEDKRGN